MELLIFIWNCYFGLCAKFEIVLNNEITWTSSIFHLKEILYGGAISRRQKTGYKLWFSADIPLAMLMAVIHGLFAVSTGSTKPTPRQEASYSSRYRALYRALTDVIIPQSDNFEMHAISTILPKKE